MTAAAVPEHAVSATVHVDPADPVFAGHYPGFPVLPGLYVVEHVHQAVLASLAGIRLAALEKAKFHKPVRPGDRLRIQATVTDDLHCAATVSSSAGVVAEVRLRYVPGGSR